MNLNMNSAESLVAQSQGLSGNIAELAQLRNYLKQSDDWLHAESTRIAPLIRELDPSIHSLGYLYILGLRLVERIEFRLRRFETFDFGAYTLFGETAQDTYKDSGTSAPISKEQANELVLSVARFINACEAEQIRLAPDKFISVCKRLKDQVMLLEDPMRGVAPLLTAIRKLQMSSEQGMICIGLKKFCNALELLNNVVAPMPIIRAIGVEAYKKCILVSLIHLGQFAASLPKYTSSAALRNLKNFSQPYLELVNFYSTGKISELETCVQSKKDKFESDKNLGLLKQVVSSMYKRNIQRLTQMYLTLSLQEIANTVQLNSPKEAEMHVLQMIQEGEIYATIKQTDGMVRFLEDPEQYKTCPVIEHIDLSIQRIMMLSKKLTTMNEIMSCDPSYLGKAGKECQRFDFDDFDIVPSKFNI